MMTDVGPALEIHRLLDEAFAGVPVTADLQDLKEEMRANLVVRVAELERSGVPTAQAAQRAIAELGDIRSVIDESEVPVGRPGPAARHQVRPKPAYVVRTVVLAVIVAAAVAVLVVPVFGAAVALVWQFASAAVGAVAAGVIVADALGQETTTNYPIPARRAVGYGIATVLALAGAGSAALWLRHASVPWLVGGGLAVLMAIIGFTYLGATQTNRHKPWAVRLRATQQEAGDRFTEDPAAAARFGLYTATIWLVAFAAFAVLTITVGWAWSWLALLGGVVAMTVTLARTLFAPTTVDSKRD
jgi:MFS family permease